MVAVADSGVASEVDMIVLISIPWVAARSEKEINHRDTESTEKKGAFKEAQFYFLPQWSLCLRGKNYRTTFTMSSLTARRIALRWFVRSRRQRPGRKAEKAEINSGYYSQARDCVPEPPVILINCKQCLYYVLSFCKPVTILLTLRTISELYFPWTQIDYHSKVTTGDN